MSNRQCVTPTDPRRSASGGPQAARDLVVASSGVLRRLSLSPVRAMTSGGSTCPATLATRQNGVCAEGRHGHGRVTRRVRGPRQRLRPGYTHLTANRMRRASGLFGRIAANGDWAARPRIRSLRAIGVEAARDTLDDPHATRKRVAALHPQAHCRRTRRTAGTVGTAQWPAPFIRSVAPHRAAHES